MYRHCSLTAKLCYSFLVLLLTAPGLARADSELFLTVGASLTSVRLHEPNAPRKQPSVGAELGVLSIRDDIAGGGFAVGGDWLTRQHSSSIVWGVGRLFFLFAMIDVGPALLLSGPNNQVGIHERLHLGPFVLGGAQFAGDGAERLFEIGIELGFPYSLRKWRGKGAGNEDRNRH